MIPNRHPDPVAFARRIGVCGLILSGGGDVSPSLGTWDGRPVRAPGSIYGIAPERDQTETLLLRASVEEAWPVIGVCRGMQVLNLFHGGGIVKVQGHAGIKHPLRAVASSDVLDGHAFDIVVNSFHDFGIPTDGVGRDIRILAEADGMPEAILHETMLHLGLMWHPERNQPFSSNDIQIFRRFYGVSSNWES